MRLSIVRSHTRAPGGCFSYIWNLACNLIEQLGKDELESGFEVGSAGIENPRRFVGNKTGAVSPHAIAHMKSHIPIVSRMADKNKA